MGGAPGSSEVLPRGFSAHNFTLYLKLLFNFVELVVTNMTMVYDLTNGINRNREIEI